MREYLFPWQKDWINAVGQDSILYGIIILQNNYITWAGTV